jgi:16S rRNA (guanine527-N7)-methyltransferase
MTPDPPPTLPLRARLEEELLISRHFGFLGPGDIPAQIDRSLAFLRLCDGPAGLSIDLGSGGGLPGLVLAAAQPDREWVLLDANHRRTEYLTDAVRRLGMTNVQVTCQRAENAGRGTLRGRAQLVTARGFASPAPTAECAAPLLSVGGVLIVAEPPGAPARWPASGLAMVGLIEDTAIVDPVALRRFRQVTICDERFPRRVGIPGKRPLFS